MSESYDLKSRDYEVRYTAEEDAPFLKAWMSDPKVANWLYVLDADEIELAVKVWLGFSRYQCCLTATWKGEPIGMGILYLMPYRKVAHHCLMKIIVPPGNQKKGIGTSLMKNLKHLAKSYFHLKFVQMEIVENNPALFLLEKGEFKEFARQEKYFKIDGEYAARILLQCDMRDNG